MTKEELSLEELSAATGMTARNVRAYQTKGLIPPPTRSGRRSVYGVDHLHRLQAIERARAKGASLSLIAAHLAAGRRLDDDTLVDWATGGSEDPHEPDPGPRASDAGSTGSGRNAEPAAEDIAAQDITALLARLDIQRDATAQEHVEQLVAAGVFRRPEGGRVLTGRRLAGALLGLQQQGLPLQVALGIAQRALQAATPVAVALHEAVCGESTDAQPSPAARGPLGEVACYVIHHVVTQYTPDDGTR